MGFADKLLSSRTELIRQFTCQVEGRDAWFVIFVSDKNKLQIYLSDVKSGKAIDLPDYGKILYKGWGAEPPADIIEKLQAEYNQ